MPSINLENKLMIKCCQHYFNHDSKDEIIHILSRDYLDWEQFEHLCGWHGVVPIAHQVLTEFSNLITKDPLARLKFLHESNHAKNIINTHELLSLLDKLYRKNILPIVFKGPVLSELAYGNIGCRQFTDFDLLFRLHDFAAAIDIFLSKGFKYTIPFDRRRRAQCLNKHGQITIDKDSLPIDLHLSIFPDCYNIKFDEKYLFHDANYINLINKPLYTFNRENHFIISCIHGHLHHWRRLKMVNDVYAFLVGQKKLNWDYIFEICREYKVFGLVQLAVFISYYILSMPDAFTESFKGPLSRKVIKAAENVAFNFNGAPVNHPGAVKAFKNYVFFREGVYPKLASSFKLIFYPNPEDFQAIKNHKFAWLSFINRPLRIIKKHGL